jgi:hypothetical protein
MRTLLCAFLSLLRALTIMLASTITIFASVASRVLAHGVSEHQTPIAGPFEALWYNKLPGDGGTQVTN